MQSPILDISSIDLTLKILKGKWNVSIIWALRDGIPQRYNQIKRSLPGITNMMLSQSLKILEAYGVVQRKLYDEAPIRVEYRLTHNGSILFSLLNLLGRWGQQYINDFK